jgi:hypothetical protein
VKTLADLHPDEMSPREALEALYALKLLAAKPAPSLPSPASGGG